MARPRAPISVTSDDLANEAFPYMTAREITLGHVPVTALRVTYVGELGWELYCPMEYGLGLWDAIWAAGPVARAGGGRYRAVEIFGDWIDGAVAAEPLYDLSGVPSRA